MRWFGTSALVLLPFTSACGSAPPAAPRTAAAPTTAPSPVARAGANAPTTEPIPTDAMHRADAIYRDQLATQGRDERFSTDRQIAALEQAIVLYRQFLERAGDDPHYAEAAKRSRERIEDAKETLIFLRQAP